LFILLLFTPLLAFSRGGNEEVSGGGSEVGGGGNVVVLPDDSVHLADPFIVRPAEDGIQSFKDLHPSLIAELERIGKLLVRLGAATDDHIDTKASNRALSEEEKRQIRMTRYLTRDFQAKFLISNIENPVTEYKFVDQFPSSCRPVGDIGPTPDGYRVRELGCTKGPTTYILKEYFEKLSIREQALSLVHERMHGLIRDFEHHFITDVTQGLKILLDFYNQQQSGQRPVLTDQQKLFLKGTLKALGVTGLNEGSPEEEWEFWQNWEVASGGGLFHKSAKVSKGAYLGVGSLLGEGGLMDSGSEFMNSTCYLAACELRDGSSVTNAVISLKPSSDITEYQPKSFSVVFGRNIRVSGSARFLVSGKSDTGERLSLGDGTVIENVDLSGFAVMKTGQGALLRNLGIAFTPMPQAKVRFEVMDGAGVQNLRVPVLAGDMTAKSSSEYVLSIPSRRQLDFKLASVCEDARQWILIKRSIQLDDEEALRGQCRMGF
jgi:hypothetical protein